ncbi:MAG: hypothetical protein M3R13_00415 [Armatimonadota bacterium]|nr:hypothetical protein [Armatimonadota bacterium]
MKFLPILLAAIMLAGCTGTTGDKARVPEPTAPVDSEIPTAARQANYEKAADAYQADKTDAATKKAYVDATVAYGTAMMTAERKYPKALALYSEALRVDPANDEAKVNRQLILDIYKQLGKEPPKSK